jgi:prepilin-type N-terminal cleavage/methylation domain-containing protein
MRHAFTIVELTVTICILGVISAIAMPSVGKLLDGVHVRGAVLEIESMFGGAPTHCDRPVRADNDRYRHGQSDDLRQRWGRDASEAGDSQGSRSSVVGDSGADVLLGDWHGIRCREPQRLRATELVRRYRFCVATGSPAALIDGARIMSTGSDSDATGTGVSDVVPKS